jgi:hypothetical protein
VPQTQNENDIEKNQRRHLRYTIENRRNLDELNGKRKNLCGGKGPNDPDLRGRSAWSLTALCTRTDQTEDGKQKESEVRAARSPA